MKSVQKPIKFDMTFICLHAMVINYYNVKDHAELKLNERKESY